MGDMDKSEKFTVAGYLYIAGMLRDRRIQAEFARRRVERERRRAERENRGW